MLKYWRKVLAALLGGARAPETLPVLTAAEAARLRTEGERRGTRPWNQDRPAAQSTVGAEQLDYMLRMYGTAATEARLRAAAKGRIKRGT
jgi:hypothetical protein